MRIPRRTLLKGITGSAAAGIFSVAAPSILRAQDEVKIGFIAPISGPFALPGIDMMQASQLAVDEINAAGIAGRKFTLLVEDNKLEPKATLDAARKLIQRDGVDAIIGVLSSPDRVAALSVTNAAEKLFIYPAFYEGGECHKYFFSTGSVPNQSVDPVVPWLMKNVGKRVYVMGNDFLYPRGMAKLIKEAVAREGGEFVGEEYYPFGTGEYGAIFQRAGAAKADVIWVMDAGQPVMVQQYRQFEMKPQLITTMIHENLTAQAGGAAEGVLANSTYFNSVDTDENRKFLAAYRDRFGKKIHPTTFGEAQYDSVWLYAKAIEKAGSADRDKVLKALAEVEFAGPQGRVSFSAANQHARVNSFVGRVNAGGLIDIVESFGQTDPVVPGCKLG